MNYTIYDIETDEITGIDYLKTVKVVRNGTVRQLAKDYWHVHRHEGMVIGHDDTKTLAYQNRLRMMFEYRQCRFRGWVSWERRRLFYSLMQERFPHYQFTF